MIGKNAIISHTLINHQWRDPIRKHLFKRKKTINIDLDTPKSINHFNCQIH